MEDGRRRHPERKKGRCLSRAAGLATPTCPAHSQGLQNCLPEQPPSLRPAAPLSRGGGKGGMWFLQRHLRREPIGPESPAAGDPRGQRSEAQPLREGTQGLAVPAHRLRQGPDHRVASASPPGIGDAARRILATESQAKRLPLSPAEKGPPQRGPCEPGSRTLTQPKELRALNAPKRPTWHQLIKSTLPTAKCTI